MEPHFSQFLLAGIKTLGGSQGHECVLIHSKDASVPEPIEHGPCMIL